MAGACATTHRWMEGACLSGNLASEAEAMDMLAHSRELQQLLVAFLFLSGLALPLIVWWSERW